MKTKISLTEFVDVIIKAGTEKLTKVRNIKNKPEYDPRFDFYRPLRNYLIEYHKENDYSIERKKALPGIWWETPENAKLRT